MKMTTKTTKKINKNLFNKEKIEIKLNISKIRDV